MGFLTPNNPPSNQSVVRRILLPGDSSWTSVFDGHLLDLCYAYNWEQHGEMTPQEVADWFWERYPEFTKDFTETPNSDNVNDLDGTPVAPWYENVYDWIIAGFLAITFTPAAAITYQATVPKLRIAFRTGNIGALFRVLINGVEVWTGDSYGPIVDLIDRTFDTSGYATPYTVRIEHNGVGPNVQGNAKLEYVRNEALADMVATILRADPMGCGIQWSQDNGGTWNTIDLAECITSLATDAANSAINQAITDGKLQQPGGQPSPTSAPLPGECKKFHVALNAGAVWYSPCPIGYGDTVSVTGLKGGWNDGSFIWYCPDGYTYALGQCNPDDRFHDPGDPLAGTAYHMQVVGHIGTAWFDPVNDVFTNQGGTELQDFTLQANDGSLSDNTGDVEFDVEICKSSAIAGCYQFDFTTGEHGFVIYGWPGAGWVSGEYVSGEGYRATLYSGSYYVSPYHNSSIGSFSFTDIEFDFYNPNATDVTLTMSVWNQNSALRYVGSPVIAPGEQTVTHGWSTTWGSGSNPWLAINASQAGVILRRWRFIGCDAQPTGTTPC